MKTAQLMILQKELDLLKKHLKASSLSDFNKKQLLTELESAQVFKENELPADAICIDSTVSIQEEISGKTFSFQIVLPAEADMRQHKMSVFAPIGIALLGYRVGAKVQWEMPDGLKTFQILSVHHQDLNPV